MSARRLRLAATEDAAIDLEDIQADTLTQWELDQARHYEYSLDSAFATLQEQPHLGVPRDELVTGLREYTIQSHVVFYLVRADTFIVQRILHQIRDASRAFPP